MSTSTKNSPAHEVDAIEHVAAQKKRAAGAVEHGSAQQKKLKKTAAAPTEPVSAKEVDAFKTKLAKSAFSTIKKTGHSRRNTPWSTIQLGIPSKEFALQVLGDIGGKVTSSGAITERREVNGHARISNWLGLTEYGGLVHPVKFSGMCLAPIGTTPSVYVWAAIDEMVSSIKANQWTLKFKTRMCASGIHTVGKLDKAVEESDEKLESENENEA